MKRQTWQRTAVQQALAARDDFVSAQGLHSALKAGGSPIGLATVYRALADLAVEGEADSLQAEGESLYRACSSPGHHHHLICRSCGRTIEIQADDIEAWAGRVAKQYGFTSPRHVVDVFGTCSACATRLSSRPE